MHGIQTGSKTGTVLSHTSFVSSFGFQGVIKLSFPPTPNMSQMCVNTLEWRSTVRYTESGCLKIVTGFRPGWKDAVSSVLRAGQWMLLTVWDTAHYMLIGKARMFPVTHPWAHCYACLKTLLRRNFQKPQKKKKISLGQKVCPGEFRKWIGLLLLREVEGGCDVFLPWNSIYFMYKN